MPADPRCPSCGEKVSATARWCMHCGVDFDEPADAAETSGGETTVQTDRESAVAAATRGASTADARYESDAREPDAVREARTHESPAETPDIADIVTDEGDKSAASESALAPLFAFLDRGEWRLLSFVFAVCLGFFVLVESATMPLWSVEFVATLALGWYMFGRLTARGTVAAGATGAGLLTLGVRGFDVVGLTLDEGTGAAVALLVQSRLTLLVAVALVAVGRYLDH